MDHVRELRRRKGWSQVHLAQAAGVARATIQRIEAGQVVPNTETANALAAALDANAQKIRDAAGLAAQVSEAMDIILARDASQVELERLPQSVREVFVNYQRARAELEAAQEAMRIASDASAAAASQKDQAATACNLLLRRVVADPENAETRRAFTHAVARLRSLQGNNSAPADFAMTTASRRAARAFERFSETGLEVSRLLMRLV